MKYDRRTTLDPLIAAQAISRGARLITRNRRDFARIEGLRRRSRERRDPPRPSAAPPFCVRRLARCCYVGAMQNLRFRPGAAAALLGAAPAPAQAPAVCRSNADDRAWLAACADGKETRP